MASQCSRCGQAPKVPGRGQKFCKECKAIQSSTATDRMMASARENQRKVRSGERVPSRRMNKNAPPGARWCSDCNRYLKLALFNRIKGGHMYICRECQSARDHSMRIARVYGITTEEYVSILESQAGGCAICGNRPKRQRLAVDHDHKTGMVRGLLCKMCNHRVLGGARDDIEILRKAVDYLDSPPAPKVIGERVVP